jgi:hypothetical protein
VLEPASWVGGELPILDYIDIGDKLRNGTWLVLFYHYDCPECDYAISICEQVARDLTGDTDFLKIALVEIPPYGPYAGSDSSPCIVGQLVDTKDWFVATPTTILLSGGQTQMVWEEKIPNLDLILRSMTSTTNHIGKRT